MQKLEARIETHRTLPPRTQDHLWSSNWPSHLRLNRYGAISESARIVFKGSPPRRIRVQMNGNASFAPAIVRVSYGRPEVPVVAQGVRVWSSPNITDPHGTWYWNNKERTLEVAVHHDAPALTASLTNLVMVSARISVTDAAFWAAQTMEFVAYVAFTLGIPSSTIVVVGMDPPVATRRALRGASATGSIDFAWTAPGAPNSTLLANQAALEQVMSLGFGGIVVESFATFISAPLCAEGECVCPFGSNNTDICEPPRSAGPFVVNNNGDDDSLPLIIAVSVVVPAVACAAAVAARVLWKRRGRRVEHTHDYPWFRNKLLGRGAAQYGGFYKRVNGKKVACRLSL